MATLMWVGLVFAVVALSVALAATQAKLGAARNRLADALLARDSQASQITELRETAEAHMRNIERLTMRRFSSEVPK